MRKIVSAKGGFTLVDMLMIGASKVISERLISATPIGNGTLISGAVKLAGAYGVQKFATGKAGTIIGAGLAVDGVEDVITGAMGMFGAGASSSGSVI